MTDELATIIAMLLSFVWGMIAYARLETLFREEKDK